MSEPSGWLTFEQRQAKLLELRVWGGFWAWFWYADVFLGPIPLLKLHFALMIVVPVLARPQNARPLVESIEATASMEWRLLFVCSDEDRSQIEACYELCADPRLDSLIRDDPPGPGDYAAKIQRGYDCGLDQKTPYVLLAADDLRFHPGWDTEALAIFEAFDVGVVGTNDLGHPGVKAGQHSTHPFVARKYIDSLGGVVGMPGQVYFEGYDHNYVDVELVETAKARGCYAHAHNSRIEHRHPLWDRSVTKDETYAKGRAGFQADRALYESRKHLWERERVAS